MVMTMILSVAVIMVFSVSSSHAKMHSCIVGEEQRFYKPLELSRHGLEIHIALTLKVSIANFEIS